MSVDWHLDGAILRDASFGFLELPHEFSAETIVLENKSDTQFLTLSLEDGGTEDYDLIFPKNGPTAIGQVLTVVDIQSGLLEWKTLTGGSVANDTTMLINAAHPLNGGGSFTLNSATSQSVTIGMSAVPGLTQQPVGSHDANVVNVPRLTVDSFGRITSLTTSTFNRAKNSLVTFSGGAGIQFKTGLTPAAAAVATPTGMASFTLNQSTDLHAIVGLTDKVSAGTYGSSTEIPVLTVDTSGVITSISTASRPAPNDSKVSFGAGDGLLVDNSKTSVDITLNNASNQSLTYSLEPVASYTGASTTIGDASNYPILSVDAYGRVVSSTTSPIATANDSAVTLRSTGGITIRKKLAGTATGIAGSTTIAGVGTTFFTSIRLHSTMMIGDEVVEIANVPNETTLNTVSPLRSSHTNADVYAREVSGVDEATFTLNSATDETISLSLPNVIQGGIYGNSGQNFTIGVTSDGLIESIDEIAVAQQPMNSKVYMSSTDRYVDYTGATVSMPYSLRSFSTSGFLKLDENVRSLGTFLSVSADTITFLESALYTFDISYTLSLDSINNAAASLTKFNLRFNEDVSGTGVGSFANESDRNLAWQEMSVYPVTSSNGAENTFHFMVSKSYNANDRIKMRVYTGNTSYASLFINRARVTIRQLS